MVALVAATAACGDNLAGGDHMVTAVGGARLALQKYRYDDGTELAAAGEFYDTQLHVRCTPEPWLDGAVRCTPTADDTGYADASCTALIGVARTIARPTHIVAREPGPAGRIATGVFRAGAAGAAVTQTWRLAGGACVGPVAVPPGVMAFAIDDEVDRSALVELRTGERGAGRLGLELRETDDGLRAPFALRDRELGAACAVGQPDGGGGAACEPSDAAPASWFADAACSQPAVATTAAPPPAIARLIEPSGCASYHRVGRELAAIFQRDGDACIRVDASALGRAFALDGAIELAELARSIEPAPGRRLHRVILSHGDLRFLDDQLFDPEIGTECRPRTLRDAIRCVPASVAAIALFTDPLCTAPLRAAELPQRTCERPGFATTNRPFQLRPIDDPLPFPAFRLDDAGACRSYTGAPGNELRALGAPLDLAAFATAIYFGER
jgi:hypothetical protein